MYSAEVVIRKLVSLRKISKISQKQMAEILKVSHRTYQRIEYGDAKLSIDLFVKIVNLFKLTPDYFFTPSNDLLQQEISKLKTRSTTKTDLSKNLSSGLMHDIVHTSKIFFKSNKWDSLPYCLSSVDTIEFSSITQNALKLKKDTYAVSNLVDKPHYFHDLLQFVISQPKGVVLLAESTAKFPNNVIKKGIHIIKPFKRIYDNPQVSSVIVELPGLSFSPNQITELENLVSSELNRPVQYIPDMMTD